MTVLTVSWRFSSAPSDTRQAITAECPYLAATCKAHSPDYQIYKNFNLINVLKDYNSLTDVRF